MEINRDQAEREAGGVKQLLADVTELGELQARLMADDVRSSLRAIIQPIIYVVISVALLMGTVPVLLLALANLLVDQQQWSPHMAQFACAGIALVVTVSGGAIAWRQFRRCASPLHRSLKEMEKNLETLREMLVGKDTPQQPRQPR